MNSKFLDFNARELSVVIHALTTLIHSKQTLNDETNELLEIRDRLVPVYRHLSTLDANERSFVENQTSFPTMRN